MGVISVPLQVSTAKAVKGRRMGKELMERKEKRNGTQEENNGKRKSIAYRDDKS